MKKLISLFAFALMFACGNAFSFDLVISGDIDKYTDPKSKSYVFSETELMRMPVREIRTSTAWTAESRFEGVPILDLLKKVGARGKVITVYTLDDYYEDIPVSDFEKYGTILAYKMNGKMLSLKNFGPLFVIYPRDTGGAELSGPLYSTRFLWQVYKIVVK
ncbi:oxidoreductase molybdopterin binding domain protein [Burkholderia thailandensis MSMB121]|uniref:molybdopterin-dependent oxidoreductase n=1 Tax=Burkholderia humptydooensis TaxID=430531 RepID=UPI00032808A2|nr:molybdopterin-dependent oxidoreductase [Burkholderia humptydooensis]AGK48885.1 oxidoreductase molybdopterin binding domain protein [Burkholderia thailandensis MSMB121]ATF36861.1 oxidoreductase [Burkholderia thailandensis]KST74237.1 oxidoreductase [Burkholderia humptydooensis]